MPEAKGVPTNDVASTGIDGHKRIGAALLAWKIYNLRREGKWSVCPTVVRYVHDNAGFRGIRGKCIPMKCSSTS